MEKFVNWGMKKIIWIFLVLVGMFAFAQSGEIEILRTIGGDQYQVLETVQIFGDSVYLQTDKGFVCFYYFEIDTAFHFKPKKL